MNMKKYIPEYKALTGKEVSPTVVRFAERMDDVGQIMADQGRRDAARGHAALPDDAFKLWAKKLVRDDLEMVDTIADLLRLYYMDGYNGKGDSE